MTPNAERLIAQFHTALGKASDAQHLAIQRAVTDLFLAASSYTERQLAIFNGIIGLLIERVDREALLELSSRLAEADHAPYLIMGRLCWNDDIAIAGPVLEKSKVLTDENLVEVARTKAQDHLMAIAGRKEVSETVTDALVDRGNPTVTHKVVANNGARLSELGFVKVVHEARSDEALASALASRKDVPPELQPFLKLARKSANAPRPLRLHERASRPQEKWERITPGSGGWDR